MDPQHRGGQDQLGGFPRTRGDGPSSSSASGHSAAVSPHTRGWTRLRRCRLPDLRGFPAHAGMDPRLSFCAIAARRFPPHTRGWTLAGAFGRERLQGFPAHAGMDPCPAARSHGRCRFPRTRGDGPHAPELLTPDDGVSPHTRGWTQSSSSRTPSCRGFPAHAGMDPSRSFALYGWSRFPRTRGDGPKGRTRGDGPRPQHHHGRVSAVSPHTRGWTLGLRLHMQVYEGFPAHAGMDPGALRCGCRGAWFPRTRGDGPVNLPSPRPGAGPGRVSPHTLPGPIAPRFPRTRGDGPRSPRPGAGPGRFPRTRGDGPLSALHGRLDFAVSPHTRGWTRLGDVITGLGQGFPPHTRGWTSAGHGLNLQHSGFPRTRGDGPTVSAGCPRRAKVSPHTRGWTPGPTPRPCGRRGFPAHAGMDRICSRRRGTPPGFPRTRGDGPDRFMVVVVYAKVSPHTRGWTAAERRIAFIHDGFPRTRGDGPRGLECPMTRGAVSPHTRGWTPTTGCSTRPRWGFPAHAGMDPDDSRRRFRRSGFPRTRGDGPTHLGLTGPELQVSPHTRGWTRHQGHVRRAVRGFPAHAGMDPCRGWRAGEGTGFPRTRGDGPDATTSNNVPDTVSPHTRGWTLANLLERQVGGGVPAHAGMDPRGRRLPRGPRGFPRTRGDGPSASRGSCLRCSVSPHTRGWTLAPLDIGRGVRGFPAHAGMDPLPRSRRTETRWFPRTRAGWTCTPCPTSCHHVGFPAHAGMDPGCGVDSPASIGFPRTRGDGPRSRQSATTTCPVSPHTRGWTLPEPRRSRRICSVSPHTRGWTSCHHRRHRHRHGFPAHAGMDPVDIDAARLSAGFPAHAGMDPWAR